MLIRRRKSWEVREADATPEGAYLNRRALLAGLGLGAAGAGLAAAVPARANVLTSLFGKPGDPLMRPVTPTDDLYPAPRNEAFTLDRELTPEKINATYNNFYEFGSHKEIWTAAQSLPVRPWTVTIDGMVEQTRTVDVDTLIREMGLEERLYRHRCVEAWSMTIPWTGFPLARLVEAAKPLSGAKYVRFETFKDESIAPGQKQSWYPWPYVEGVTMAEAMNDLAFIATGTYGHSILQQHGAPLRLVLPWKYGFKSIKSIARISFVEERPVSFWEELQASEYGFWANVNPEVPHPRWSQAEERILHTGDKVPTLLFNGYGEQVADLYAGMPDTRALYM